jgi:hypothetical protein
MFLSSLRLIHELFSRTESIRHRSCCATVRIASSDSNPIICRSGRSNGNRHHSIAVFQSHLIASTRGTEPRRTVVSRECQESGDFRPDMVGRILPDFNVRQMGDSRERIRVFVDGSLGAIWFDNCSAPELDSGHDASVRQSIRRRWSAIRETTAARFSLSPDLPRCSLENDITTE